MSSDFDDLISAIQRDPSDDAPRWAFADLCDRYSERQHVERATFVRFGLRNPESRLSALHVGQMAMQASDEEMIAFRLMWSHWPTWGVPTRDVWDRTHWSRGFVSAFDGHFSLWWNAGWQLLRQHPVVMVMTEKSPCPSAEKTFFYAAPVDDSPTVSSTWPVYEVATPVEKFILPRSVVSQLFASEDALPGSFLTCVQFATAELAQGALSRVLLRMAKARCADKGSDRFHPLLPLQGANP